MLIDVNDAVIIGEISSTGVTMRSKVVPGVAPVAAELQPHGAGGREPRRAADVDLQPIRLT